MRNSHSFQHHDDISINFINPDWKSNHVSCGKCFHVQNLESHQMRSPIRKSAFTQCLTYSPAIATYIIHYLLTLCNMFNIRLFFFLYPHMQWINILLDEEIFLLHHRILYFGIHLLCKSQPVTTSVYPSLRWGFLRVVEVYSQMMLPFSTPFPPHWWSLVRFLVVKGGERRNRMKN